MNKYNEVEFDFVSWSWHGIADDILNVWCKRFGEDLVSSTLVDLREYLKKHLEYEEKIKNWAIWIWNCLEIAEGWKKEKNYQEYRDYENYERRKENETNTTT